MNNILIGNIISLLGSSLMILAGIVKRKNTIVKMQCAQFSLMAAAQMVLGGFTGVIANIVSLVRNLFCLRFELTLTWKLVFISVQSVLSVIFNNHGAVGYLPLVAVVIFTWFLDTKSDMTFKLVLTITQAMWLVYDAVIKNYVGIAFDTAALAADIIGIIRLRKEEP